MKSPAFQLYAQDFLTGCTYLTNEEIGMYIKMLCKQWTDGNIPKKRLGFLLGLEWVSISEELRSKFTDCGDYVINERLEKEREKKKIYSSVQSENGKKGGRPRKNKTSEDCGNAEEKSQSKPNAFKNKKPNQSQKKPIEDRSMKYENEIEEEKGKESLREKPEKVNLRMPFESETFRSQWQLWKLYKKKQHSFNYKSDITEQAALNDLLELSGGDEKTAIAIIDQSIKKSWKGFFELKAASQNGKSAASFAKNR